MPFEAKKATFWLQKTLLLHKKCIPFKGENFKISFGAGCVVSHKKKACWLNPFFFLSFATVFFLFIPPLPSVFGNLVRSIFAFSWISFRPNIEKIEKFSKFHEQKVLVFLSVL